MTSPDTLAGVPAPLRNAFEKRGFTQLTRVQAAVLAAIGEGGGARNLRISSQTGSGKTVAIGIALAHSLLSELASEVAQRSSATASESEDDGAELAADGAELAADGVDPAADVADASEAELDATDADDGAAASLTEADASEPTPSEPAPRAAAKPRHNPRGGRRPGPQALVITPTRELAAQVQTELEWLFEAHPDVRVDVFTGGTDVRREKIRLRTPPAIVVGTPGRLADHIRSGALDTGSIREVVLDEADQMLDMGFKDELDQIVDSLPEERRSHLVSATFPPEVRRLAQSFQGDALQVEGTALGQANSDIEHTAHLIRPKQQYAAIVNLLLDSWGERCLIFVRTRVDTAELCEALAGDGFGALPFSGELPQAQRTRTLDAFKNGTINILVATDVAARGIDVPDIGMVIHADIPKDTDIYTHRSGRTGRAGKTGKSMIIVPVNAQARVARMFKMARIEPRWEPVPSPKKILQGVTKATRRRLYERLEGAEYSEAELTYAQNLIDKQPPAQVVAMLLRMAEPPLPRAPIEVAPCEPRAWDPRARPAVGATREYGSREYAPRDFGSRDNAPRDFGSRDHASRGEYAARDQREHAPRGERQGFVRFALSWGAKHGANPSRCLSHVCRRGGIGRESIGSIDIGEEISSVEISEAVAAEFEQRCATPDPRDPLVRITRDHGAGVPPRNGSVRPPRARLSFQKGRPPRAELEHAAPGPRVKRAARRQRPQTRPSEA